MSTPSSVSAIVSNVQAIDTFDAFEAQLKKSMTLFCEDPKNKKYIKLSDKVVNWVCTNIDKSQTLSSDFDINEMHAFFEGYEICHPSEKVTYESVVRGGNYKSVAVTGDYKSVAHANHVSNTSDRSVVSTSFSNPQNCPKMVFWAILCLEEKPLSEDKTLSEGELYCTIWATKVCKGCKRKHPSRKHEQIIKDFLSFLKNLYIPQEGYCKHRMCFNKDCLWKHVVLSHEDFIKLFINFLQTKKLDRVTDIVRMHGLVDAVAQPAKQYADAVEQAAPAKQYPVAAKQYADAVKQSAVKQYPVAAKQPAAAIEQSAESDYKVVNSKKKIPVKQTLGSSVYTLLTPKEEEEKAKFKAEYALRVASKTKCTDSIKHWADAESDEESDDEAKA